MTAKFYTRQTVSSDRHDACTRALISFLRVFFLYASPNELLDFGNRARLLNVRVAASTIFFSTSERVVIRITKRVRFAERVVYTIAGEASPNVFIFGRFVTRNAVILSNGSGFLISKKKKTVIRNREDRFV